MPEEKTKRLSIDMDKLTHSHIKRVAIGKEQTMRQWIMEAVAEKMIKDHDLGFK